MARTLSVELGAADLTTTSDTLIYTCPSGPPARQATVAINVITRTNNPTVRIATTPGTTPGNKDWIEYDVALSVGASVVREGITMKAGDRVYVRASTANEVTAKVYGVEEDVP